MPVPLLSTKLYIPTARADGVPRPRLIEKLDSFMSRPGGLALLSGPAGFGKTTLLSEFASQRKASAAWVSLDEGDNDPVRFWSYVIAAAQTVQPGVGEAALSMLQSPQPLPGEMIPAVLVNDLTQFQSKNVLILDDFHVIHNAAILTGLSFLLDQLSDRLHLVISTRVDPTWPLARLRARNQLVEIRAQDFRFTLEESAAFLNQVMGLDLSKEDLTALEERTEGWAAGLQLAGLSMQGRADIAGFLKTFTGSHAYIAEYLIEEVLQRQSQTFQTFLLQTSFLSALNAGLCEAVTGCENGQSLLMALKRANLFVVPLDDEGRWFRYHHLFADLLKAHLRQALGAEDIEALHQRAALWYEQAGMIPEAIDRAAAAHDEPHLVNLVGKAALPMLLQGHVGTVEGWLQSIPQEYTDRSPKIMLAFTWMHMLRGTFAQAAPFLQQLEVIFSQPEIGNHHPSLLAEWLAIKSKVLAAQGKHSESQSLAQQGLRLLPEGNAHIRSMLLVNLASAYQEMMDYEHAADTFQMIVLDARAEGNHVLETLGISGQARMVIQQGNLHLAFQLASEGIARLEASGKTTPFSATLYGELGQIHFLWHHLDQAINYLQRSSETSGKNGYSDPEIYTHIMLSRKHQMEGDWTAADLEMQAARDLAKQIPPAMIREEVISQQVRVDLAFDRLSAAQECLKSDGFTFTGGFNFPGLTAGPELTVRPVTHPLGMLYNSALRVVLYQARQNHDLSSAARAVELAGLALAGELQCGHIPIALETLLLRSQLFAVMGDVQNELADVCAALELGQAEGFISGFIEEGPAIAEALALLVESGLPAVIRPEYVADIRAGFPGKQPDEAAPVEPNVPVSPALPPQVDTLVEPLTRRELDVLKLIALGDSNQAVAEKLFITLSAVKKHTGNIFGKLNVSSRTQAVARAYLLGLITRDT